MSTPDNPNKTVPGEIEQQYLKLKAASTKDGGEISVQYLNLRAEGTKGGLLIKELSVILSRPETKPKP